MLLKIYSALLVQKMNFARNVQIMENFFLTLLLVR